ncbi:MAG TPA: type II secretion system F family protein [Oligoflexia bacterium]|nr:type II secretion system F family protein [Oligoflexia bacterium]HMP48918.1 type II secretion system F family protein [Oligoflexia bacterium]
MPQFYWEGTSSKGKRLKGTLQAANAQAVFNQLRSQRITPDVKKIKEKGKGLDREIKVPGFAPKVKSKDIVVFTRQFATMIDAGLPIVQGLDVLAKQHENPAMRRTLGKIKETVEVGGTLADGMKEHPKAFDNLFVNMVAAGEAGGILDIILERMANYLEKSLALKRQVKTAMIYPAVVVFAAVVVTAVLLIFVIPTFAEMFSEFGSALPAPTMMVLALSDFMVANYYYIGAGGMIIFYLFRRFAKTEKGKDVLHPLFLKMPIAGELIRKVAVARFTRTLGTMLSSGVPILEALSICAKTAGNRVVEREVNGIRVAISEGKRLVDPLENSVVFPPMVVQMIGVGESTGALDAMLNKVADFYESEVEVAVAGMKQLIEPVMILFLGTVVGGLVIAMYLPIFKLGSVIH